MKEKHNSPLPFELLYKHNSLAKGYSCDAPLPTKVIDNFEELKDGTNPSKPIHFRCPYKAIITGVRVTIMQYFRLSTIDKGQRNYSARVFDRHMNRAELTMNFDNDENAMKVDPGRVITLKGIVSIKGMEAQFT